MCTSVHIDPEVGMAVIFLAGAIAFEVVGTLFLRASDGFSRLWPSVGTAAGYLLAFVLLAQALRTIDVGVAYAVWAGVGTALITVIGILALGEPATALKLGGTALIVVGVVALNLSGGAH
jgi:small multidrug resistance pump